MAKLCLLNNDGIAQESWALGESPFAVGRSDADALIEDESLSRRHFVIVKDQGGYIIEDLQSANGTWVDGKRVVATRLRANECIVAGRCVFMFTHEASRAPARVKVPLDPVQAKVPAVS